jgi:hypothetical protein
MIPTRIEPADRADVIRAAIENFRSSTIGTIAFRATCYACGFNASETQTLVEEHQPVFNAALHKALSKGYER